MDNLTELIQKAQAGDKKALGDVVNITLPFVIRYSKNEDVVQNVSLKILSKIHLFDTDTKLGDWWGWVYRVIRNDNNKDYNKNNKEVVYSKLVDDPTILTDANFSVNQPDLVLDKNRDKRLVKAIHKILDDDKSIKTKEVFKLRVFYGLKHSEIAEYLNISDGTSKTQYQRCKTIVKKELIKQGYNV